MRHARNTLLFVFILAAAAFPLDPFNYTVAVKNFSADIYRAGTSRYRLASSDSEFTIITNTHQRVLREQIIGGKKVLDIEAGGASSDRAPAGPAPGEYLKDTRFVNLSSPEIAGAAAGLAGKQDPVRAVEDFVYDHIAEKTYGIPLVPAVQVFRMKRGDCTEHTVLAVALLRRLGVPARAIVGMYLADEFLGKRNVFVFHMWAEAYRNGGWTTVDATRPGNARLNRYIAFAEHNLRAETPLPYLRVISTIQDLTVEYLGK